MDVDKCQGLLEKSRNVRKALIKMLGAAGSGHSGGSLSAVDILVSLYFEVMNVDPQNPDMETRDRFVLSKGHAAPALYAVLAERGFIKESLLSSLRKLGSPLQGHPDRLKLPGIDATTGSLGQGFSWSVGMAIAAKMDNKDHRIFALLGDGELEEGIVWEAAMAAGHYALDNLIAIIDNNGLQIDGWTKEVMNVDPISDKFAAFGWNTYTIDGHDFKEIISAINQAQSCKGRPTAIVARTTKGKGCSFMENRIEWHGVAPNEKEVELALDELDIR